MQAHLQTHSYTHIHVIPICMHKKLIPIYIQISNSYKHAHTQVIPTCICAQEGSSTHKHPSSSYKYTHNSHTDTNM